jgi:hypothetical protein
MQSQNRVENAPYYAMLHTCTCKPGSTFSWRSTNACPGQPVAALWNTLAHCVGPSAVATHFTSMPLPEQSCKQGIPAEHLQPQAVTRNNSLLPALHCTMLAFSAGAHGHVSPPVSGSC